MPPKIARFDTGEEPIDGYVLVEFLGRGQFGEVWKARDKASGRLLAVKIIDLTFSPTALKELRAFKLVKNLNHPNLIPIFTARLKNRRDKEVDFDKADKLPKGDLKELVIVMGLGEKSLSQRLKELNADGTPPEERQGIPLPELIRYMRGAAKGIDFLNDPDHGLAGGTGDGPIIHCDIKPENLMIVAGEVQIADCGVAVIISPDMRQTRAAGSPAYSAPELSGNKPGPGTDQYALAISYYELRTGRLPFPEEASLQQIILAHALGDLDFSASVLSDAERDVLRRATARVPADRFETCDEFIEELSALPDIRVAIKSHRRSSTHLFPSRGSDDFRLPGTGNTPIGDGTGTPAPGARSDPFSPRQSDPVKSDFPPRATPKPSPVSDPSPARPGVAPPRPKDGAIDYDVAAQGEPVPRPETGSWKEFAASPPDEAPPGREGGTLHFELPESKAADQPTVPTPWLPFPAPRTPSGPPPGLIATTVLPDLLPQPGPVPESPTAGSGGRETVLPTPSTDTPRDGAGRPIVPPVPGVTGMPVNPDDPLGKKYGLAEPDTIIRGIIGGVPGVKVPPARPAEPAVPPVARKPDAVPKKKKAAQPAKRSADESIEVSKPAWFKEAVAEDARKPPGTAPEKKQPTPVFLPAIEAKKSGPKALAKTAPSGDWRQTATPSTGRKGKLIALIAAGIVAFAGVGAGIAYIMSRTNGDPDPSSAKAPDTPPDPKPPDPKPPEPEPPEPKPMPRVKPDAEKYAEFEKELKQLEPGKDLPVFTTKLRAAFAEFAGKPDFKVKLAEVAIEQAKPPVNRWDVWRIVQDAYPAPELKDAPEAAALRKKVAQWKVNDLQKAFEKEAEPALAALAVPAVSEDLVKKAKASVAEWQKPLGEAKAEFGADWPDTVLQPGVESVVKMWQVAANEPTDDPAKRPNFAELKKLAGQEASPALPALVAFEYFRLAPDTEPIEDLRRVRDKSAAWGMALSQGQRTAIDAHFQGKLASLVRMRLLEESPDHVQIARECGNDTANGWKAAAEAEVALLKKSADADSKVRAIEGATPDLKHFQRYLAALADAQTNRIDSAADALADLHKEPSDLLKTDSRRKKAVEVLLGAARRVVHQDVMFGINPYPSGSNGRTGVERLRAADKVSLGTRPEVALHLYLAATAMGETGLDEVASRAANVNPRKLLDRPDAEAGLAFYQLTAGQGSTEDRLKAYAGAVRCAVRILEADRSKERIDGDDKRSAQNTIAKIASAFLERGLKLAGDAVPSGPGMAPYAELAVRKAMFRASGLLDMDSSLSQVLERLNQVVTALLGSIDPTNDKAVAVAARQNPVLAEALACRAYVTLLRFVMQEKDRYKEGDPESERAWRRLRADAEAAVASEEAKPQLAHLALAYAGFTEFQLSDAFSAPKSFRRRLAKASTGDIKIVADHFQEACDLVGNAKYQKPTMLFARAKYLFYAANTIAKTGHDMSLVRRYLKDARAAITEAQGIRAVQRYEETYQIGAVREDLAWFLREDPQENYTAALKAFAEGENAPGGSRVAQLAPADVARCTARGVMFGYLPKSLIEDARRGLRSIPADASPDEKAEALYWQGLMEWANNDPVEADAQLKRVFDEVKDPEKATYHVLEFAILAHGLRGQIAIARDRGNDGGARMVTLVGETATALDALFAAQSVRKEFSHYSFFAAYFRGWKAYKDGNRTEAVAQFAAAFESIRDLDRKYELQVEQPIPLECLATELELLGTQLPPADRAARVKLLVDLRRRFAWALTESQASRIDEIITKSRQK